MNQEELKQLKSEGFTLTRIKSALEKDLETLKDDILFTQDKLKESKVLTARQRKQRDEMLPYRELIEKEINEKKKELEEYKRIALVEKTFAEEAYRASLKNDIDFKKQNQQRLNGIAQKEKDLDIRQEEIEDNLLALDKERAKTEQERGSLANEMAKVKEKLEEMTKMIREITKDRVKIDKKKEELNEREAQTVIKEQLAEKKNTTIDGIILVLNKEKLVIIEENKAILIQKRLLSEQQKNIDDDRIHLSSQQTAFSLAVREARKKWQMPK